jgi:chemotaxis protein MotB
MQLEEPEDTLVIPVPPEVPVAENTVPPEILNEPIEIPNKSETAISIENAQDKPTKEKQKDKSKEKESLIIIKKIKKGGHGHHGGAWKIAFADFVTAMMAFFLLMWLLASLNKAQKEGVADYFKQPIKVALFGGDSQGNREMNINGGGQDIETKDGQVKASNKPLYDKKPAALSESPGDKEREAQQLEALKSSITASLSHDPELADLKDHLLMDVTSDGLRIQLIDNKNKPMFGAGSDDIDLQTKRMMNKIAALINKLPNKVSIQGHTDAHPYQDPEDIEQTNWELSTQRANTARRALIKAGMDEKKVMQVSGFASTVLLDKSNPFNASNRRISIIVMKKEAENKLIKNE